MRKLLTASTIAAITITLTACGGNSDDEYHGVMRSEAKDACHERIKSQLKSPGSADFEGFTETQYSPSTKGVYVDGYVDSQNSFGAKIRTTFQCDVWKEGEKLMVSVTKSQESA